MDLAKRRGVTLDELLEEAAELITEQHPETADEPKIH